MEEISGLSPDPMDNFLCEPDPTLPLPRRRIGIEIELEHVRIADLKPNNIYWEYGHDDSLRNYSNELRGIEFRLRKPIWGKDIRAALDNLEDMLKGSPPHASIRCSDHLHFDVRDLTIEELKLIVSVYVIFERLIFNYIGQDRENSFYCVPLWKFLPAVIQQSAEAGLSTGKATQYLKCFPKYSALHLDSALHIGSIEFRAMTGEYKADKLMEYLIILMSVVKFALEAKLAEHEIPKFFSYHGVEKVVKDVFGEELYEKVKYDNMVMDVYEGIRLSQEHLFSTEMINNLIDMETEEDTSQLTDIQRNFVDKHKEYFPRNFGKQIKKNDHDYFRIDEPDLPEDEKVEEEEEVRAKIRKAGNPFVHLNPAVDVFAADPPRVLEIDGDVIWGMDEILPMEGED